MKRSNEHTNFSTHLISKLCVTIPQVKTCHSYCLRIQQILTEKSYAQYAILHGLRDSLKMCDMKKAIVWLNRHRQKYCNIKLHVIPSSELILFFLALIKASDEWHGAVFAVISITQLEIIEWIRNEMRPKNYSKYLEIWKNWQFRQYTRWLILMSSNSLETFILNFSFSALYSILWIGFCLLINKAVSRFQCLHLRYVRVRRSAYACFCSYLAPKC